MEEPMEDLSRSMNGTGRTIGLFQLAKYLIFAQNHRINSGGDAKQVVGDMLIFPYVEILPESGNVIIIKIGIEFPYNFEWFPLLESHKIKFNSITGGKDCRFSDLRQYSQTRICLSQIFPANLERLSFLQRTAFMVNAAYNQMPI